VPADVACLSALTTARVVRFLGLTELTENTDEYPARFALGVLYPYSRDLQRVCRCYDALCELCPEGASILVGERTGKLAPLNRDQSGVVTEYLASIATLANRIAFAPGRAGESVGVAYRVASNALVPPTASRERRGRLTRTLP